jgi:hypothetical protein
MSPSTRTTGNDPAEGVDPGGTHSTQPGKRGGDGTRVDHPVDSGDRNTRESSEVAPATRDGTSDSGPGVT